MKIKIALFFLVSAITLTDCMERQNDSVHLSSSKKRKLRKKRSYDNSLQKEQLAQAVLLQLFCPPYKSTQIPLDLWLPDLEPIEPEDEKEILFCDVRSEFLPMIPCSNYDLLSMLDYDGWFIMASQQSI